MARLRFTLQLLGLAAVAAALSACSSCEGRDQGPAVADTEATPAVDAAMAAAPQASDSGSVAESPPPPDDLSQRTIYYSSNDGMIHRIRADGSDHAELGLHTDTGYSGTMDRGESRPKVSADGQWIAYMVDDDLWAAHTDGSGAVRLAQHTPDRGRSIAEILISGWSPSQSQLLFNIQQASYEDRSPPLPQGVSEGFYLWTPGDEQPHHLPWLQCFSGWTSTPGRIVCNVAVSETGQISNDPIYQSIESDAAIEERPGSQGAAAGAQPSYAAGRMVFNNNNQLFISALDGSAPVAISEAGRWAQYNNPHLSPDLRHVVYVERSESDSYQVVITPATGPEPRVLRQCAGACTQAVWIGNWTLVVQDNREVWIVRLEGEPRRLAEDGSLIY